MANSAEVNARFDALDAAVATERQQFIDLLAQKDQQIADLQSQLANTITAADGDAFISRIDTAAANVSAIVP